MGVMGLGYPDLRRANPEVLAASLHRLPLAELVGDERYQASAPDDLIAEREAPGAGADLMATVLDLGWSTQFTDEPVEARAVFEILRAAQWAPSAGNFQPLRYVVIRDPARRGRLAELARESVEISAHWFPRYRTNLGEHPDWDAVPLAIAVIADPTRGGPHIHGEATHMHAGGMAVQNMAIMAAALGLGTTLVTHWIEEKLKTLIDCPRTWDLVGVMPFGVPVQRRPRVRPPLEAIVHGDRFGRSGRPAP
jgi:nitroreductase